MGNPKAVPTRSNEVNPNDVLAALGDLSVEQKAKLFAMLRTETAVVTQANSEIDAEVKQLNARIEELKAQVQPINEEIGRHMLRIKALTGKGSSPVGVAGERKARTTKVCVECGQGRHADNDKTKACSLAKKQVAQNVA